MIFKGRVQGVGFRWTVVEHAENTGITGSVENLSDGSVKVVAQGNEEQLTLFLEAIQKDPGHASISSVKKQPQTLTQIHARFTIK